MPQFRVNMHAVIEAPNAEIARGLVNHTASSPSLLNDFIENGEYAEDIPDDGLALVTFDVDSINPEPSAAN